MLEFILLTIIFWAAGVAILKFLFAMVQPGGLLDVAFGWQSKLDRWYGKGAEGSKIHKWMHDALGGCQMCTSFWFAPFWYIVYMIFVKYTTGWFIDDRADSMIGIFFINCIWYVVFWNVSALFGLGILKLFNKIRGDKK